MYSQPYLVHGVNHQDFLQHRTNKGSQGAVKNEPSIPQAVAFPLKGHEADKPLQGIVCAEELRDRQKREVPWDFVAILKSYLDKTCLEWIVIHC